MKKKIAIFLFAACVLVFASSTIKVFHIKFDDNTTETTAGAQPGSCGGGQFVNAISASGAPSCATPSGGSGTVTSFSAGNFSPLFTTSVSNATTTPALSFTASTATANRFFAGPASGSPAAPTFRVPVPLDLAMTTSGDTIYDNAGAIARLALGTPGQTLSVNSAGTAPQWGNPFSTVAGPQNVPIAATTIIPSGTSGVFAISPFISVVTPCTTGQAAVQVVITSTDDSGLPISDGTSANADPGFPVITAAQVNFFQSTGGVYSPLLAIPTMLSVASNGSAPVQYQVYYVPCNAGVFTCSAGVPDCTSTPGVPSCTSAGTPSCGAGQTVACHRQYNASATVSNRWAPVCDIDAESGHGTYVFRLGLK